MTHTMKKETGFTGTTLRQRNKSVYWAWKSMKQRCLNPKCIAYKNYGARGITICSEWNDFEPFCSWALSNGHEKGLELDRIDNDGPYAPYNCRWTSRKTNLNNRRKTLMLTVNGITKCRTEWERELTLPTGLVKAWCVTHDKEYAESRLKDILIYGYREKDFGYSHRKRVMHVETGEVFDSVRTAGKVFGINPSEISNAIRFNRATHGNHFTYDIL